MGEIGIEESVSNGAAAVGQGSFERFVDSLHAVPLETVLVSLVLGVVASLVASAAFLFFLKRLRPKVEISEFISSFVSEDGSKLWGFKILNLGSRDIIDVEADLSFFVPKTVHGGTVWAGADMELIRSKAFKVSKYDRNDKGARYAYRFYSRVNLDELWETKKNGRIRFRIIATDSLSSFKDVFERTYYIKANSIKEGRHNFGMDMGVSKE